MLQKQNGGWTHACVVTDQESISIRINSSVPPCGSFFGLMCSALYITVCPLVLCLAIVLHCLLLFTASDYPLCYLQTLLILFIFIYRDPKVVYVAETKWGLNTRMCGHRSGVNINKNQLPDVYHYFRKPDLSIIVCILTIARNDGYFAHLHI
jgi:hypothetical protein